MKGGVGNSPVNLSLNQTSPPRLLYFVQYLALGNFHTVVELP